jgi:serine/threonine-protein kinase HipA
LDCAGAVRFVTPERLAEAIRRPGGVTWLTKDEVAALIRDLHADSTAWLGKSFTGQFSLAGAQAKTALLRHDGRWGLPHGAAATTHIIKPAVVGLDNHDLNEHLCLDAARRAGLIAARTQVERFGDQTAVVVERYDRRKVRKQMLRVHQEDLCQALGFPPTKMYQNDGGPKPEQIVELLRKVVSPLKADDAVARFFDALVWNWLIGGTDAHAKNYSLLLSGGEVRLAPMYDVASALPYGMHERKLKFAMKIGGRYDVVPYPASLAKAAHEMGIAEEIAYDRIRELAAVAPDAFAESASDADIVTLNSDLPDKLVAIIAERAARCIELIDLSSAQRA